jgi:hypothetical protein
MYVYLACVYAYTFSISIKGRVTIVSSLFHLKKKINKEKIPSMHIVWLLKKELVPIEAVLMGYYILMKIF